MDENELTADAEVQPESEDSANEQQSDPDLKRAIKRRDSALKRAQEAEARLKEYEQKIEQVEEEKERSAGELSKVVERLEKRLAERDEELGTLREEKAKRAAAKRRDSFIDAIADQTGVQNKVRLRALAREAAEANGFDIAPEEYTKAQVTEVVKAMKQLDPETFAPVQTKGSPTPGQGVRPGPVNTSQSDYWAKVARAGGLANYRKQQMNNG